MEVNYFLKVSESQLRFNTLQHIGHKEMGLSLYIKSHLKDQISRGWMDDL